MENSPRKKRVIAFGLALGIGASTVAGCTNGRQTSIEPTITPQPHRPIDQTKPIGVPPKVEVSNGLKSGDKITATNIITPTDSPNSYRVFNPGSKEMKALCFIYSDHESAIISQQLDNNDEDTKFGFLLSAKDGITYLSEVGFNNNSKLVSEFTLGIALTYQKLLLYSYLNPSTGNEYEVLVYPTDNRVIVAVTQITLL